jgi:arylsulfatase A
MISWLRAVPAFAFIVATLAGGASDAPPSKAADVTPRPNFIFIQAEAQGWSSTSVDMDGQPPSSARPAGLTPNLETLAKDGMRFSDFYVSAPRCTPSRASWVTGIGPSKLRMTYQNEPGGGAVGERYKLMRTIPPEPEADLPAGVRTTGAVLKDLGYASAHFGKWHVGRKAPSAVGFDLCDGNNSNQGPERGVAPNPKQAQLITDRGIAFMRDQVKAGKPFYLQLSHYGFGGEQEATPEALAAAKELVPGVSGKPAGAVAGARDVDTQLGRVLAAVKELGIADRTYVFYSADHGAQGGGGGGRSRANPPFSGGKGSVSEGGIRVPFIACGPGIPPGKVTDVRATNMDLLPTILDLASATPKEQPKLDQRTAMEGGSLAAVLRAGNGPVSRPYEGIAIHFPHYDLNNGGPASAFYLGSWKLVRNYDSGRVSLYDVAKDRSESTDLATQQPDVVKDLESRLDAYLKAVDAPMARVNTAPGAGTGTAPDRAEDGRGKGGRGGGQGSAQGGGGRRRQQKEQQGQQGQTPKGADS